MKRSIYKKMSRRRNNRIVRIERRRRKRLKGNNLMIV